MKLVDSSLWVEFLRRKGDPRIKNRVARLLEENQIACTCPIRFELLSGVKADEEDYLKRALEFSNHIAFEENDWRAAAALERQLRTRGVSIPRNDLFVATVAIRAEIAVLCRDQHFNIAQKIVGHRLQVEQI